MSGMAKGIDACAATVCINEGGYTIAVLGNGLDICYPSEHQLLMDKIREKGLLISEYPPGTRPTRYNFPKRNRLISAWSDKEYEFGTAFHKYEQGKTDNDSREEE